MGKPKIFKSGYWKERIYSRTYKKYEKKKKSLALSHDILVIVGGGLGDTIMQLPVILELKRSYKKGKILVAMQDRFTEHYDYLGVDAIQYTLSNSVLKRVKINKLFLENLSQRNFEYVLHMGGHSEFLKINNLSKYISSQYWIGSGSSILDLKNELKSKTIQVNEKSILQDYRKYLFEVFKDEKYYSSFSFNIDWPDLKTDRVNIITIGIGSSDKTHILDILKMEEFMKVLLKKFPTCTFYLLGAGKEQNSYAEEICNKVKSDNIISLANRSDLLNTFSLINSSKLFVGMDSGLYNISSILGTKTIGFFAHKSKYEHKELSNVRTLVGDGNIDNTQYTSGGPMLNSIKIEQLIEAIYSLEVK